MKISTILTATVTLACLVTYVVADADMPHSRPTASQQGAAGSELPSNACQRCRGTGRYPASPTERVLQVVIPCPWCNGTGRVCLPKATKPWIDPIPWPAQR
jgi:DnaJ-class molecular chaperone